MLKYQIYGVLLFIILLILIYLINKKTNKKLNQILNEKDANTKSMNKINLNEGFEDPPLPDPGTGTGTSTGTGTTPSPTISPSLRYHRYDNAFFDLNAIEIINNPAKPLEEYLNDCLTSQTCLGITRDKTTGNIRKILKTDRCSTEYQGSDIQKSKSYNYETYIKKTVNNYDQLCITNESMNNPFSIETSNDLILCIQNKNLLGMSKLLVKNNKLFELTQFMIVKGIYNKELGTVSIRPVYEKYSNYYFVNDYPKKDYLFLKEIDTNNENEKKKATFKITNGLSGKGFSIKILGFPNIYFRIESASISKDNIMLSSIDIDDESKEAATFYIKPSNPETSLLEIEQEQAVKDDVRLLSVEEKVKLMKKNNINKLEHQVYDLNNQNKKIDDMNYYHLNNINYIGREFANQAAELSLSSFLKEKEAIQKLALQTPSPDNMRFTPAPNSSKSN